MPHDLNTPEWTWLIVVYFFLGGIAAGSYFSAALLELFGEEQDRVAARIGHLIAFPLLVICGLLLIFDLGRPERFWHMLLQSKTYLPMLKWWSPMSAGSWALAIFSAMAFVSFVDALVERRRGRGFLHGGPLGTLWTLLGSAVGFFFASYTGVLLQVTSFPVWANTTWIGALFMASAASTGLATMALLLRLRRSSPLGTRHKLEEADRYAMVLELVIIVAFVASLGAFAFPFLANPVGALVLWGGVVLLGLLVPLGLQWLSRGSLRPTPAVTAALLTLVGGLLLRIAVVMVPQGVFG